MRRAANQRAEWAEAIGSGRYTFSYLVAQSQTDEYKYLAKLKLVDILVKRPGWTTSSAAEILDHNGFSVKDNVQSIRRSRRKIEAFEVILKADRFDWRARPELPAGWPWYGKLSYLVDLTGDEHAQRTLTRETSREEAEEVVEKSPDLDMESDQGDSVPDDPFAAIDGILDDD